MALNYGVEILAVQIEVQKLRHRSPPKGFSALAWLAKPQTRIRQSQAEPLYAAGAARIASGEFEYPSPRHHDEKGALRAGQAAVVLDLPPVMRDQVRIGINITFPIDDQLYAASAIWRQGIDNTGNQGLAGEILLPVEHGDLRHQAGEERLNL